MRNRKGFFFIVCTLILLIYIISNLSLWSKSIQLQEERYSEEFRISNMKYVVSQLSDEMILNFSKVSAKYALYSINGHSINNPIKKGPESEWKYKYINLSMHGLIVNGLADSGYFENDAALAYESEKNYSYSFAGMFSRINESFSKMGLEITDYRIEDFYFNQSAVDTVNVSFSLYFKVEDSLGKMASLEKEMDISFNFSIQGLDDPSIAREMQKIDPNSEQVNKGIFFNFDEYSADLDSNDLKISNSGLGKGGGWFYGPIYQASESFDEDPFIAMNYIIAGTAQEINANPEHSFFGAYYVIEPSDHYLDAVSNLGIEKPIFVSDLASAHNCPDGECLFFVSEFNVGSAELKDPSKNQQAIAYDIEKFRDFVLCGYYFQNPEGPSYFDKLLDDSYVKNYQDNEYGIATFLVWDGIEKGAAVRDKSRLDLEFFDSDSIDGKIIRGMSGCKNQMMCSEEGVYLGRFKLSENSISEYLGGGLSSPFVCGNWADCSD
ncbi:MAG: hypothetical protein WC501_01610 [Candidatus Micrarchaeia archaeon]